LRENLFSFVWILFLLATDTTFGLCFIHKIAPSCCPKWSERHPLREIGIWWLFTQFHSFRSDWHVTSFSQLSRTCCNFVTAALSYQWIMLSWSSEVSLIVS